MMHGLTNLKLTLLLNMITYKIMKTENGYNQTYTGENEATQRRGPKSVQLSSNCTMVQFYNAF